MQLNHPGLLTIAVLSFLTALPVCSQTIYKCTNAAGKIEYSGTPCSANAQGDRLQKWGNVINNDPSGKLGSKDNPTNTERPPLAAPQAASSANSSSPTKPIHELNCLKQSPGLRVKSRDGEQSPSSLKGTQIDDLRKCSDAK